jgi:glycosyltransferase involved in cell wall biosynthesis
MGVKNKKNNCNGEVSDLKSDLKLVVCGGRGWMANGTYKRAKESKFSKDIIFTGSVSDCELMQLYKNALMFVLLSLYEGFGLPVLEAMNFGIPCVVSDNSSLGEIAGGSALLINAYDSNDIAEKISMLLASEELRKDFSRRGIENVKRFNWIESARKTLEVFKSIE